MKKIINLTIVALIMLSIILTGCGKSDPLVGQWAKIDRDGNVTNTVMSFYEDGTCLNTPVKNITSAEAVSYVLQDDGMLIFEMEWDGSCTYEKTYDIELALDDWDYYYLSGDTLVLQKTEYIRQ